MTGNTFIFFQNGESAHLVITLSNIYVLMLMYFFMLSDIGFQGSAPVTQEIKKYVKIELGSSRFGETGLDVIKIDDKTNYDDIDLSVDTF